MSTITNFNDQSNEDEDQDAFTESNVPLFERAKYLAGVGIPSLIGLELLGTGAAGMAIALLIGGAAAYFSGEIREGVTALAQMSGGIRETTLPIVLAGVSGRRRVDENEDGDLDTIFESEAEAVVRTLPPPPPDKSDCYCLSPTLSPHANMIFSGRKVLIGVSDAGKSNNVAVLCEEGGKFGIPLVLFDTEGEYRSLCHKNYFPHPRYLDSSILTPANAYAFATRIMEETLQCVINLQTYEDADAAWIMINLIKGLKDWEEARPEGDRIPCEAILDEATVWLPQQTNLSALAKIMVEDPDALEDEESGKRKTVSLLTLLQRAFFSIVVRRGRKRGIGLTLAAQRPAELDKQALAASWVFLMRQTQAADFKVYKEFGIEAEEAMSLRPGEAFVFAPGKVKERHQFRLRHSPHGAKTPGLDELRRHLRSTNIRVPQAIATAQEPPSTRQHSYQPSLPKSIPTVAPVVPTLPPLPQREHTQSQAQVLSHPVRSRDDEKIERALRYWNEGHDSVRKLEKAMGISNYETRRLVDLMEKKNLITRRKSATKNEGVEVC